jgi:hypothetical protein
MEQTAKSSDDFPHFPSPRWGSTLPRESEVVDSQRAPEGYRCRRRDPNRAEAFSGTGRKIGTARTNCLADQLNRSAQLSQVGRVTRSFANRHVIHPPVCREWSKFRASCNSSAFGGEVSDSESGRPEAGCYHTMDQERHDAGTQPEEGREDRHWR